MNDWQLLSVAYFIIIMPSNTFKLQYCDLHSSSPLAIILKMNKTKFSKRQSGPRVGHEGGVGKMYGSTHS